LKQWKKRACCSGKNRGVGGVLQAGAADSRMTVCTVSMEKASSRRLPFATFSNVATRRLASRRKYCCGCIGDEVRRWERTGSGARVLSIRLGMWRSLARGWGDVFFFFLSLTHLLESRDKERQAWWKFGCRRLGSVGAREGVMCVDRVRAGVGAGEGREKRARKRKRWRR